MMKTFAFYVVRQFLFRCALVLVGTAAFALAADLMESGKNVATIDDSSWRVLFEYGLLRLPTYVSALLPVSSLIAGLWTVAVLYRQQELVAIFNTGLSPTGLIRIVLIGSLPLVLLQFALDDRIVPASVQELRSWDWANASHDYFTPQTDGWLWLYSGNDIVRAEHADRKSRTFRNVTIFRRDADGLLEERVDAPFARFTENGMVLQNAVVQSVNDPETRPAPNYTWIGRIDFEIIQMLSWAPSDLSLSQLSQVIDNAGYGQRPVNIYRTWYNARLIAALQPLLMLLLSMSLIPTYSRTGSFAWIFLVGISIGFASFILTGITTAMGEAGLLPPWLAAGAPAIALLALIARFLLQHEVLTSNRRRATGLA
ncbi:MAG: LptF/LptG family permease [Kiloniellales bacterium]|jgi:lipopolysaccharide export system permease protein|nr:LptF/LptG family permease [Kiloniellales bacterium]